MTTRMTHPEHGAMHAYDTGEVDRLKAQGWEVEKLSIPGEKAAPAPSAEAEPEKVPESFKRSYVRKVK